MFYMSYRFSFLEHICESLASQKSAGVRVFQSENIRKALFQEYVFEDLKKKSKIT